MWLSRLARHLMTIVVILLLGGFLAATMVRFAPGFDTDEQQLDARLSPESIAALRQARARDKNVFVFYWRYLKNAAHGDLGESRTLGRPVRELLRERLPATMKVVGAGLVTGWALALSCALAVVFARVAAVSIDAASISGLVVCLPAAVLALLFV